MKKWIHLILISILLIFTWSCGSTVSNVSRFSVLHINIPGEDIYHITLHNGKIYVQGDRGIYVLDDKMEEWIPLYTISEPIIRNFHFIEDELYFIEGDEIARCGDGNRIKIPFGKKFYIDFLIDDSRIFVIAAKDRFDYSESSSDGVYYSENGGKDWEILKEGLKSTILTKICLTKNGDVLVSGDGGIYKFNLNEKKFVKFLDIDDVIVDFECIYDDNNNLRYIIAGSSRHLYKYDCLSRHLKSTVFPEDIYPILTDIYVFNNEKVITSHWWKGVLICDINDLENFHQVPGGEYGGTGVLRIGDQVFITNWGGYYAVVVSDLETKEVRVVNKGLKGYRNVRTLYYSEDNSYIIFPTGRGFIKRDLVNLEDQEFPIGESIGEVTNLRKYEDGYFYFQDYDVNVWRTKDFTDYEKLIPNMNIGGQGYQFSKDMKRLYVLTAEGKFLCFDTETQELLYEGEGLPEQLQYGDGGAVFQVSDADESFMAVGVLRSWGEDRMLYISKDYGKHWEYLTTMDGLGCIRFINGIMYFNKNGMVYSYDPSTKITRAFEDFSNVVIFNFLDSYLVIANNESIRIYDFTTHRKVFEYTYENDIGGIWALQRVGRKLFLLSDLDTIMISYLGDQSTSIEISIYSFTQILQNFFKSKINDLVFFLSLYERHFHERLKKLVKSRIAYFIT